MIRVIVLGGHKLERDGLALLLATDTSFVAICDGDEPRDAFARASGGTADVVLIDIDRAPDRAAQTLQQVSKLAPHSRVLVLTANTDRELAGALVLEGARGIVSKDRSGEHLLDAIRKVHEGELWIDRATSAHLIADLADKRARVTADPEQAKIASLTPRERDVVALAAKGHSNKAIAERMKISDNTVRHHLTSIFSKLGIADRVALVVYTYQHKVD